MKRKKPIKAKAAKMKVPKEGPITSEPIKDWAGKLEAAHLRKWADCLDGIPPGAAFRAPDERMLPILPDERREIAEHLRFLANHPHALEVMLAAIRGPERRGPRPDTRRTWLATLEFRLRRRGWKADLLAAEVARAWAMSRSALFAAVGENTDRKAANRNPGGWRYWAVYEIRRFRATHREIRPRARRAAFIEYLRSLQ